MKVFFELIVVGAVLAGSVRQSLKEVSSTYQLYGGLARQDVFSNIAEMLAPSVVRQEQDLYDRPEAIEYLLATETDGKAVYEALLKSQLEKRGQPDEGFDKNREKQVEYVEGLYDALLCRSPESEPSAMFVTGQTAVGKSSFLRTVAQLPARTIHVNADDIRAMLLGNWATYVTMTGNIRSGSEWTFVSNLTRLPRPLYGDANKVRFWVQGEALKRKCNFVADSLTVPAGPVNEFVAAKFNTKVFYLEVGFKGTEYEHQNSAGCQQKVELTSQRIENDMKNGGHFRLIKNDDIENTRSNMANVSEDIQADFFFFVSQADTYEPVSREAITCNKCTTTPCSA